MKLVLIALTLIACGIATGDQDPQQIRVSLQFIEAPHATLTQVSYDEAVGLEFAGIRF